MWIRSNDKQGELKLHVNHTGLRINYLKFNGKEFMLPLQNVNYGTKEKPLKKQRGTHFCIPVFGKPPKKSSLHGKIPQHGFIRKMKFALNRINQSKMHTQFEIAQSNNYPWKIKGEILIQCTKNSLTITIYLTRAWNCSATVLAPINIGFHPYWINNQGVSVFMNGYSGSIDKIINPSFHTHYLGGPIEIKLHGIGTVHMEMTGNCLKSPEIVMWSDNSKFICIEPVAANVKNFDTNKGIMLRKGEEAQVSFHLNFNDKK